MSERGMYFKKERQLRQKLEYGGSCLIEGPVIPSKEPSSSNFTTEGRLGYYSIPLKYYAHTYASASWPVMELNQSIFCQTIQEQRFGLM